MLQLYTGYGVGPGAQSDRFVQHRGDDPGRGLSALVRVTVSENSEDYSFMSIVIEIPA